MSLQFDETKSVLDIVDNLRSHGISRYIDLPEIVVCGEQSSGKSSVLEAISGIRFPSKDNLCTRFATELILRRGPEAPIKISIVPGSAEEDRSEHDLEALRNFNVSVPAEDLQLGEIIESAKTVMGIDDSSKVFSSDILRLELSGPDQPHLTLVDLPGLFQAGSRTQSDADSETVKSLVLEYMKNPRSIILAVVSAKNDFNNQSITRYARQIDPKGERTLGLITKPDTLDEGSDSERFYLELAQNKDVKFRLGWHVLRNRDYTTRHSSAEERDKTEASFFNSGIWRSLPPNQAGLPNVFGQIKGGIHDCTSTLHALGDLRDTAQQQRRYLLHVSQSFCTLVRAAIDGQYSDLFFGDASTLEGYQKRLRAVLQNTSIDFAADMRKKGHTQTIIDEGPSDPPHRISRSDYVRKVARLLERSRGRELPGTFDPLIVGQLFHEQRKPWANLVDRYLETILLAVRFLVSAALAHVCDQSTLGGISRRFIHSRLEKMTAALREKVAELLKPYHTGHPITYNHYLTDNVQKAQSRRRAKEIKKSLEGVLGGDYSTLGAVKITLNVDTLINTLVSKTEADMNIYASSTATDFMEAFYKVAMKKIIDDVSVLAVEALVVQRLPFLFSPADVVDLDDATVAALASERGEIAKERAANTEKLSVLEDGLGELQNIQGISSLLQDILWREGKSERADELNEVNPTHHIRNRRRPHEILQRQMMNMTLPSQFLMTTGVSGYRPEQPG
ncbi:P-loop containing nucleoside triphosphate hydrolase protein [Boeremia exigua]|uniref:P-loop containing nucleoside triphosphate hydrolase protein n=1 Tax=Boeremia exigua TaxID=749465 RepID=UPI001E8E1860|nr:P-loop containing nucleoside triphosphate hydrolase protein [Boeremia exigua]KAH6613151.1 P-loop containing nucleoside triphosphate hydrolase protein [Boeremia exigua]